MILRIVSGRIRKGRADAVARAYKKSYYPVAMRTPGLDGFVVGIAPLDGDHAIAAMTRWSTV